MKEKLLEILDRNEEDIAEHKRKVEDLRNKLHFYSQHNLNEEFRIVKIKHDCLSQVVFEWREQQDELRGLLQENKENQKKL